MLSMMPNIDNKKLIWTIGKQLSMSESDVRAVLLRETGKESMRACSDKELARVVLALRQIQGEGSQHTGNHATKRQVWMIGQLEEKLGWKDNSKRLQAWLKKYYQVDSVQWLTRSQAWRVIESLKKMLEKS